MERRAYLSMAALSLLAGCQALDGADSTATETATATDQPTDTPTPTPTATESQFPTETETDTPTETETRTEGSPNPRAAEELDEARTRLSRAVRRYAEESHRRDPTSILDTTADSQEFVPSRVTGSINDARLSLGRAEERASPGQQRDVDALRRFADWLEQAVAVQQLVIVAADDCRRAVAGTVPNDRSDIQAAFEDLVESAGAARSEADSLPSPDVDVGDQLEALEVGDVSAKADQLERTVDALEQLSSHGASIVEGIDLLREARGTNFTEAEQLAEDARAEFERVESAAAGLDVPDSLSEEKADLVSQATDWAEHAADKAEDYRDAQND